jgi:2-polyprenyl-3-methyl-5-hydroxy-6-metoxy-1,4-benzoquinol methylase
VAQTPAATMSTIDRFPRRPTGAGRAALRAYRLLPIRARLHATVRWWSAPFAAVQAQVPPTGRILEIGCGLGLLCTYLALSRPTRSVLGVDIDPARIGQAQQVARTLPNLDLDYGVAESGRVPAGPWDAILVVDMLYLLPAAQQRELLTAAAAELAPGGLVLVKEMSAAPRWKARLNRLQETLAVAVLGISARVEPVAGNDEPETAWSRRTSAFDFVPPEEMAGWLEELGLSCSLTRLDRRRLHPHHLLVGRQAPVHEP